LSRKLLEADARSVDAYASSFNFGPDARFDAPVGSIARRLAELWGEGAGVVTAISNRDPHEAKLLRLDASKAHTLLGWRARLSLEEGLAAVVQWYRSWRAGEDMRLVSLRQIGAYEDRCAA
jgi:CDP-glucose 4,6-dehydratase